MWYAGERVVKGELVAPGSSMERADGCRYYNKVFGNAGMNRRRLDDVERALSADLDDALTSGWRRCPREGRELAMTRQRMD